MTSLINAALVACSESPVEGRSRTISKSIETSFCFTVGAWSRHSVSHFGLPACSMTVEPPDRQPQRKGASHDSNQNPRPHADRGLLRAGLQRNAGQCRDQLAYHGRELEERANPRTG